MQNQKGISTLIGIIIIIAVALVAIGGVFAYQYYGDRNLNDTNLNEQNQQQAENQQVDNVQLIDQTTKNETGIIKSVYSANGKNYLNIDYVTINLNWKPGGSGGAAYTNDNPQIRTFEISKNAKILVGSGTYSEVTYQAFSNLFSSNQYQASNPWDIEVVDSVVTKITEHYIP